MAITSVKSTYALDVETVTTLERMAKHWKVSKSEALRRAIRIAAEAETGMNPEAIAALDELQGSLGMDANSARAWARTARAERRTSSGVSVWT